MENPSFFGEINDTISIVTNTFYPNKCIFQVIEIESNLCLRKKKMFVSFLAFMPAKEWEGRYNHMCNLNFWEG